IINSDGSEAEQCGNAIRCVAKYVYDNGLTDKEEITIETLGAGAQKVQLTVQDGKVSSVRVDMGEPILNGQRVPTTIDAEQVVEHPIEVDGREFRFT
ncbi:diaminopimelate epimerase, partial [Variovorax sp. 2RAF20]